MLIERRTKIINVNGLHARPATRFAEVASKFNSEIFVKTANKEEINGKSIIDLLTLGAKKGTELLITADGEDNEIALDALEGLVNDGFDEDSMETRKGIAVSPGVVIKEAFILESEGYRIPRHLIKEDEIPKEISRLEEAATAAWKEIEKLEDRVSENLGSEIGSIFATHKLMLQDKLLLREFSKKVEEHKFSAEYAVTLVLRVYIKKFEVLTTLISLQESGIYLI